ncbi:hypothetical protein J5N97_028765 [Dioscorea zingiberensis]|uniref:Uncharacterized protein n=1 Tax=Dioscorea zingiberensis TaxID=325984 RepID=A0A9D5BZK0_9LILI|nr:hypothetical protein J5N97_028765 [Dioscorea zingiberensis]
MDGRAVVVGWRTKWWKGEQTLPVHVCHGIANFDEIFLHCRNAADVLSILKSFTVWVSLVDAVDCDLGTFHVDLSELLAMVEDSNSEFGAGKALSFHLVGDAHGGALNLSLFCRIIEEEYDEDNIQEAIELEDQIQSKNKCTFSCLPDLKWLRSRPASARRVSSIKSDPGFITIENSVNRYPVNYNQNEDREFITMEKGRSDEEPCCLMFDVERVEDEFLRMLEDKYWRKSRDGDQKLKLSADLDLESLIEEAELELMKASQVWKSREEGVTLEKEEYEELIMKRCLSIENINTCSSTGCSQLHGFGSPI